jgi:poly [ADP-ribose] polymerase
MSNELQKAKYILADVDHNNNKFWEITRYDDNTCHVAWGRVGDRGQSKVHGFGVTVQAERFFAAKCREKEKKGYEQQRTVGARVVGALATPAPKHEIHQIAAAEIATDPVTTKLVERLVEANVHNILSAVDSSVTYDASRGTFSTPLGIIDQTAIDDARATLTAMADFVQANDFRNRDYIKLINHYLRVVPQKVPRKLDP